ncbi:unnamed protein product [Cercopithifilaria johnstoni]|uniref:Uncharacterized protein n=1 Tax=Cercopithifilaria johnstoni TaxID=2874296 RepID=A0A8J2LZ72_9BILA|nr:unnamed protein product [Cercopithifilaria johnstoni]
MNFILPDTDYPIPDMVRHASICMQSKMPQSAWAYIDEWTSISMMMDGLADELTRYGGRVDGRMDGWISL